MSQSNLDWMPPVGVVSRRDVPVVDRLMSNAEPGELTVEIDVSGAADASMTRNWGQLVSVGGAAALLSVSEWLKLGRSL